MKDISWGCCKRKIDRKKIEIEIAIIQGKEERVYDKVETVLIQEGSFEGSKTQRGNIFK